MANKNKIQCIVTDEKDKCVICKRKIYEDKFTTLTPFGFLCYKCNKFTKGEICLIADFQEFGEVLFLLERRLLKNVKGEPLSNPIWEGIIIDAKNKGLRDIWHRRISEGTYFLASSYEKNLIKLSDNSKTQGGQK